MTTETALEIGTPVNVLSAAWLPQERVIASGIVERVSTSTNGEPLYWISGRAIACSARVLRSNR